MCLGTEAVYEYTLIQLIVVTSVILLSYMHGYVNTSVWAGWKTDSIIMRQTISFLMTFSLYTYS